MDERRREHLILGGILLAAAALRIAFNNVAEYSPADERVYAEHTRDLVQHGWLSYHDWVAGYLADPQQWLYPPPLRWGFFALTTLTCHLRGECNERSLAWLSTVAGVVSVLATYLLGSRLLSRRIGLAAAALTISSPLQLAVGRRALSDEVFCAVILLALLALIPIVLEAATPRQYALATLALGFAFAIKETTFLLYPPLVVVLVAAVRRRGWRRADLVVLVAPPLFHLAGFALWAHSLGDFFRIAQMVASTANAAYPAQFQAGPPHRIFFDLFTLAPMVCVLATAALALVAREPAPVEPGLRFLALFTVAQALVFTVVTSKNVRYAIMLDPLLRILSAWVLFAFFRVRTALVIAAVAVSCAVELALFHAVFISGGVYDPVTANLMRALKAIP